MQSQNVRKSGNNAPIYEKAVLNHFTELQGLLKMNVYAFLVKEKAPDAEEKFKTAEEMISVLGDAMKDSKLIKNFRIPLAITEPMNTLQKFTTGLLKSVEEKALDRVFGEVGVFLTEIEVQARELGFSRLVIAHSPQFNQIDFQFKKVTQGNVKTCTVSFQNGEIVEISLENQDKTSANKR